MFRIMRCQENQVQVVLNLCVFRLCELFRIMRCQENQVLYVVSTVEFNHAYFVRFSHHAVPSGTHPSHKSRTTCIYNCRRLQWVKNLNLAYVKHWGGVWGSFWASSQRREGTFADQCCSLAYKYIMKLLLILILTW